MRLQKIVLLEGLQPARGGEPVNNQIREVIENVWSQGHG